MRIATYTVGIVYIFFALVQLNDPDPLLWVTIYLLTAIVSILFTHSKINKAYLIILIILSVASLAGSAYLFPPSVGDWLSAEEKSKSLHMTLPGIEEARESMGLFLCSLTFLFLALRGRRLG